MRQSAESDNIMRLGKDSVILANRTIDDHVYSKLRADFQTGTVKDQTEAR